MQDYPRGQMELLRQLELMEARFHELGRDPELDALIDEATAHFDAETAAITLLSRDEQLVRTGGGNDILHTPREVAFCNYTILDDTVFVVRDTRRDPRFRDNPATTSPPFVRFYAGAPLTYLEGLRLGAFCVFDSVPREFSLGEQAELMDFAERAVDILVRRLDLRRR